MSIIFFITETEISDRSHSKREGFGLVCDSRKYCQCSEKAEHQAQAHEVVGDIVSPIKK